jgi:uncharacterized membrane protein
MGWLDVDLIWVVWIRIYEALLVFALLWAAESVRDSARRAGRLRVEPA